MFDPSTIGSIGDSAPDPIDAMAKGVTIKDAMDREQLNSLQLGAAKQQAIEDAQVKSILQNSKYDTPQGLAETAERVNRVSPKASMDLLKTGQQYQSGQIQNQIDQLTLADKRQEMIVGAIDPIVSQARAMKNSGASDLDVKAFISQQMPNALQGLRSMRLEDGKPALPDDVLKMATSVPHDLTTLEGWEAKSKAGAAAIKQRLDQFKADTQAKAQLDRDRAESTRERAETEKERYDRSREIHQDRADAIAAHKNAGFDDRESELLASLADRNVSLPAGLRSQQQIKATVDGLFAKHPDLTADQIADGIKSGKLKLAAETKGAQTAGTQIGKVTLAVNEIKPFGQQTIEASDAVPRGKFVPYSKLKQWGEKNISDPQLLRFYTKMQALENAYNQLAGRSGTDVEKRAHIHRLFDTANSPESVRVLVQSLNEEGFGAKQAAEETIGEVSGSPSIPGTGGSPAASVQTGAPGTPATGQLPPGAKVQHRSGATVEILEQ
jgi:hypothetical protein